MKPELDLLVGARDLIADPEHWAQGAMARTSDGTETQPCDPKATCWCLLGAVVRVDMNQQAPAGALTRAWGTLDRCLPRQSGGPGVGPFNDGSTHEQVLALLDKAIALAKR